MANLECRTCGDLVDVEARTVVLPFECKWCVEGFVPTPTEKYIVQTKFVNGWARSTNEVLKGLFNTREDAYLAIANADISFERRVVVEGVPDSCDQEYMDELEFDPAFEQEPTPMSVSSAAQVAANQFDYDTKLIEDLEAQLSEAKARIEEERGYCNNLVTQNIDLTKRLNDALRLATDQELIISEKVSDIRIYRSLLGLSRG